MEICALSEKRGVREFKAGGEERQKGEGVRSALETRRERISLYFLCSALRLPHAFLFFSSFLYSSSIQQAFRILDEL